MGPDDESNPLDPSEREADADGKHRDYNLRLKREDLSDLAKLGGDLLKKTVGAGIEAMREVKKELPKEAQHFISQRKEEVLRGLSKDVAQAVLASAVDRAFSLIRQHRVEISVRIRRNDEDENEGKSSRRPASRAPK